MSFINYKQNPVDCENVFYKLCVKFLPLQKNGPYWNLILFEHNACIYVCVALFRFANTCIIHFTLTDVTERMWKADE